MKALKLISALCIIMLCISGCKNRVTGVRLDKDALTLTVGGTATLSVTVLPGDADNKDVRWTSSDHTVAVVADGKITALAMGCATITATTKDGGKTAACAVTVLHPAEGEMVFVEGGTMFMGNEVYFPNRYVTVSGFSMGKYTVTQKQWNALMEDNPSRFKGDDLPVEHVKWVELQEFISRLNAATGKNYRLPTEAEWEYAARGGRKSKGYAYSGSNDIDAVAWYYYNCYSTQPVGRKQPNELGFYDMSGNVSEFCSDFYAEYLDGPQTNPTGPASGDYRVVRGGGWDDEEVRCHVMVRFYAYAEGGAFAYHGIRLVLPQE